MSNKLATHSNTLAVYAGPAHELSTHQRHISGICRASRRTLITLEIHQQHISGLCRASTRTLNCHCTPTFENLPAADQRPRMRYMRDARATPPKAVARRPAAASRLRYCRRFLCVCVCVCLCTHTHIDTHILTRVPKVTFGEM